MTTKSNKKAKILVIINKTKTKTHKTMITNYN